MFVVDSRPRLATIVGNYPIKLIGKMLEQRRIIEKVVL